MWPFSFFLVYRFQNSELPKDSWTDTLEVKCGWGPQWEPPIADGCVDPRGCPLPPLRTSEIWGSYEDSSTKATDVGSTYW